MATTLVAEQAHTQPKEEAHGGPSAAKVFNRLSATCLTLFALIWLVPFAWALITSLRPDNENHG